MSRSVVHRFLHHPIDAGPVLFGEVLGKFLRCALNDDVYLNPAGSRNFARQPLQR